MAENEGLHLQLTADASSYISTINNAKNKLEELAHETKILKQVEKPNNFVVYFVSPVPYLITTKEL